MTNRQGPFEAPAGFCVLPWLSHFRDNDGSVHPCGLFEDPDVSVEDLKSKMLKGEWSPGCFKCQECEALEGRSYRQQKLQEFKDQAPALLAGESSSIIDLDLRIGNLCNLRCRMCDPYSTSLWSKEWNNTHPKDLHLTESQIKEVNSAPWSHDQKIWDDYLAQASGIQDISFAGGEPFLSQQVFQFLQSLIEQDESHHIKLTFITNLTVLPEKFLSLFPKFKSVSLTISIDGFGKTNEYIRSHSQFQNIEKNLRYVDENFEQLNLARASVNTTLQILNVWGIPKLIDFLSGFKNILPLPLISPLFHPEYMSVQVLPQVIRERAMEDCQKILKEYSDQPSWILDSYRLALNFLKIEAENREEYYRIFKQENLKLDKIDQVSLKECDPELYMAIYLGN